MRQDKYKQTERERGKKNNKGGAKQHKGGENKVGQNLHMVSSSDSGNRNLLGGVCSEGYAPGS